VDGGGAALRDGTTGSWASKFEILRMELVCVLAMFAALSPPQNRSMLDMKRALRQRNPGRKARCTGCCGELLFAWKTGTITRKLL
jgi:hypothetical protein